MNESWILREMNPQNVDAELWRSYHRYRRARWEERGDPDEPYLPDDRFEASWLHEWQEEDWANYEIIVSQGEEIVASFGGGAPKPGTPNHASNGHIFFSGGGVLEPWRRQGIARAWLRKVLEQMPKTGAHTLMVNTHEPAGKAFMERLAGPPKQWVRYSRTAFPTLDWALIDRWSAEAASRAPGYTLEIHEQRLPEPLWPEYCAAKEEQMRHIPRDALDMNDWSFQPKDQAEMYKWMDSMQGHHHVIWVRDPNGEIVAITDVGWYPHKADLVQQFFTGVHPKARGKGLGKWIKAEMLRLARERYADQHLQWVRTDNATSNAAMLAINERLGFREYKVAGIYQAGREQIEAFLAS